MPGARKKKEEANAPFPQDKIDLMFWQWGSGVMDILNARESLELMMNPIPSLEHVQVLVDKKIASIKEVFNGRSPTFTLTVKVVNNKFTLHKTSTL